MALLGLVGAPSIVLADGEGRGRLFVPGDHFDPGDVLAISGTDLDPGARLTLHLISGSTVTELGHAVVADDRTLAATAAVPAAFPDGYAELTATDDGGTIWSTIVLIGDRAEGPGEGQPIDERALWLGLLVVGLGILSIALLLYRRAGSTHVPSD